MKAGPGFHSRSRGPFRARRLYGDTIDTNPFELLAKGLPEARRDMASQTLVVVGATFRDGQNGFYLLTRNSTVHKPAEGEASARLQLRVVAKAN